MLFNFRDLGKEPGDKHLGIIGFAPKKTMNELSFMNKKPGSLN
jgi:hypothetical protein